MSISGFSAPTFNVPSDAPCRVNQALFDSPLMESFDSQSFREMNEHLSGDELDEQLAIAEARHNLLSKEAVEEAKKLCRECPVLNECFSWVLEVEKSMPVYGVVAANTYKQRRKERRKRGMI